MGWCVAMSRPNCERRVQDHLERQGFTTYLPSVSERVVVGGKKIWRHRLLFTRYLFVQQVATRWRSILGTVGVTRLLLDGDVPSLLPDSEIEKLKAREKNGCVVLPKSKFQQGQLVEVISGEFIGMNGLYFGMSARDREIVLLNMLGRMCKTELAAGDELVSAA